MEKYLQDMEKAIENVREEFERYKHECIANVESMTVDKYEVSNFGAIHCSKIEKLTMLSTKYNVLQEQKNILSYYMNELKNNVE